MSSQNDGERKSNLVRDILIGIIVTVVGGVIVAYIIQDARFRPAEPPIVQSPQIPTQSTQVAPSLSPDSVLNETATPQAALATRTIESAKGVQILARGTISIGIRHESMYPMFFQDGVTYKGFEIDLATEIVRRLFGNQVSIEWIPLLPEERIPAIENDQIDFLIRNTTHTKSREVQVLFTSNYLLDGVRLLVRRSEGYQGIQDLDGKTVVFPNDTSVAAVQSAAKAAGVNIIIAIDEDVATVFNERRADAIAVDWSSHGLYVDDYNMHQAVGELFSREPLAILLSLNDPAFRNEIDDTLSGIITDGAWQMIYDHWFPEPHPWSIEEMLAEPPANR